MYNVQSNTGQLPSFYPLEWNLKGDFCEGKYANISFWRPCWWEDLSPVSSTLYFLVLQHLAKKGQPGQWKFLLCVLFLVLLLFKDSPLSIQCLSGLIRVVHRTTLRRHLHPHCAISKPFKALSRDLNWVVMQRASSLRWHNSVPFRFLIYVETLDWVIKSVGLNECSAWKWELCSFVL